MFVLSRTSAFLVLLSCTFLLSSIFSADVKNEEEINPRYHVSILKLKDKEESRVFCGGSIIHRRFVLTAAQCVFDRKPSDLIVRTTGNRQSPLIPLVNDNCSEEFRGVVRIIYPKEYASGSRDNNIALVKVIGNFETEDYKHFKVLHMPPVKANYTGKLARAVSKVDELSRLVSTSAKVISNEDCLKLVEFNVTHKILCSSSLSTNARGDPLVYKDKVIGVLQDTSSTPQIYTRVSEYVGFIVKTIRDQGFNFNF